MKVSFGLLNDTYAHFTLKNYLFDFGTMINAANGTVTLVGIL